MFEPKNKFEEELVRCAQSGKIAIFAPEDHAEIRADLIRDLLLDKGDEVHANGVQVAEARITGTLDCKFAELERHLFAKNCTFESKFVLRHASIPALHLQGCTIPGLQGDGLRVAGHVSLCDAFHATGEVRLLGAMIGGNLQCTGGRFENESGDSENEGGKALSTDGARILGDVFLDGKFHAIGEVRLLGAQIGGDFTCNGGRFEKTGGNALSADRAKFNGSVFLGDGFHAIGEVRLLGAEIGGTLDCSGGRFENKGGIALAADRVKVTGSVFCGKEFHAIGEVRLLGAEIGGNLECTGGRFANKDGDDKNDNADRENKSDKALNADQAKVTGSVFLRNGFHATGEVRLSRADIGGDLSCNGGRFENKGLIVLNADGARVAGNLMLRGMQRPVGITDLAFARAAVLADDRASWPERGKLILDGFTYKSIGGTGVPLSSEARLDWLSRQLEFKPQPYRQLAEVLREMGHYRDARKIDIARHRRERPNQSPPSRVWSYVYDWTTGFGYQPWRLIWFFAALVIVGTVLSDASIDYGLMTAENQEDGTLFTPLRYAVEIVSPLRVSDLQEVWSIDESRPIGFIVVAAFGILKYLGLYGSLMAAAAMTGLLKKD